MFCLVDDNVNMFRMLSPLSLLPQLNSSEMLTSTTIWTQYVVVSNCRSFSSPLIRKKDYYLHLFPARLFLITLSFFFPTSAYRTISRNLEKTYSIRTCFNFTLTTWNSSSIQCSPLTRIYRVLVNINSYSRPCFLINFHGSATANNYIASNI